MLNGFNLKLFEGENLVVMGKSGSGKSVMVKCLVGLIQPDSGSIAIKNQDINTMGHNGIRYYYEPKLVFFFKAVPCTIP